MDGISNQESASAKKLFRFYDQGKSNSSWIDLLPNINNNNDKSDESYSAMKIRSVSSEAECCDCLTPNRGARAADGGTNGDEFDPNGIDEADRSNEDDIDDHTEGNSTDNLSFLSDDENHGLIGDIILLTENDIGERVMQSDDDSSDDCVYAYRGIEFEPVEVKPEDENDFLEMDFEPDPASEVEQDNMSQQRDGIGDIIQVSAFEHSNQADLVSDAASILTKEKFSLARKEPGNSGAARSENGFASGKSESAATADLKLARSGFENKENSVRTNGKDAQSSPTDTPNLSKKYTGTIPKTRPYANHRTFRAKSSSGMAIAGKMANHADFEPPNRSPSLAFSPWSERNHLNKRWKIADELKDPSLLTPRIGRDLLEVQTSSEYFGKLSPTTSAASHTKRSMSFSFEQSGHRKERNQEFSGASTSHGVSLHASHSQSYLPLEGCKSSETETDSVFDEGAVKLSDESATSAVIYSKDCTEDSICEALVSDGVEFPTRQGLIFL